MNTKPEGIKGESSAEQYLIDKGYKILTKNFVSYVGEIDIVARDGKYIVFVEVKSRTSLKYGRPAEAVTSDKIRKIRRTAEFYLTKNHLYGSDVRFDVVEILGGEITHIVNAF
ncbi:MAG: YraN family protein [Clostridiales bacterium]|jgi:putative endonuclease|nr:YraN family protein [Clostridiales bacterium]